VHQWDIWQVDWENRNRDYLPIGHPDRRKPRPAVIVSENPIVAGHIVAVTPIGGSPPPSLPTIKFDPSDRDWKHLGLTKRCWLWPRATREILYAECLYKRGVVGTWDGSRITTILKNLGLLPDPTGL